MGKRNPGEWRPATNGGSQQRERALRYHQQTAAVAPVGNDAAIKAEKHGGPNCSALVIPSGKPESANCKTSQFSAVIWIQAPILDPICARE
jgi:hypothetical protein